MLPLDDATKPMVSHILYYGESLGPLLKGGRLPPFPRIRAGAVNVV